MSITFDNPLFIRLYWVFLGTRHPLVYHEPLTSDTLAFFLKKLKLPPIYSLSFNNFSTPKWYFILYFCFLILSFILENNEQYHIINITIILTLVFFIEGSLIFFNFFERFKINVNIKILIIFLLFIFLGYVLLLTIIFLGLYSNFKKFIRK